MFIKQIDMNEAFRLVQNGVEVKVMIPAGDGAGWKDMMPDTLQNLLTGVMFFRSEPAMNDSEFEAAVLEMEGQEAGENPPRR